MPSSSSGSTPQERSPSKKKAASSRSTSPSKSRSVENHSSNKLYFAFVFSTFSLVAIWFARDYVWLGPKEASTVAQLARLKLLVKIQSNLLDQALGNDGASSSADIEDEEENDEDVATTGKTTISSATSSLESTMMHPEFLFLRSVELRAMKTREQFAEERARAVFDEFVYSVKKDVALLARERKASSANSKEIMLKETAQTVRMEIEKLVPDVFKTTETIQLVRSKPTDESDIDDSKHDSESATRPPSGKKIVVKTVIVDEDEDKDEDELDDGSGGRGAGTDTVTPPIKKSASTSTSKKGSKSKKKSSKGSKT